MTFGKFKSAKNAERPNASLTIRLAITSPMLMPTLNGDSDTVSACYNWRMNKTIELATARARIYPSTYKKIAALARKRRTSLAHVIAEKFRR